LGCISFGLRGTDIVVAFHVLLWSSLSNLIDIYFDHCGLFQCAQGAGWRVVASFEGVLPKRIKGLPLDSMFELSSVKKVSSLVLLKVLAVFAS
jgi:hypothetical protein